MPLERNSTTAEVAAFARRYKLPAYIVGAWVWVEFPSKPAEQIRDLLKANGFNWIPRREMWAHPCGVFRKRGTEDPIAKYGATPVNEEDAA